MANALKIEREASKRIGRKNICGSASRLFFTLHCQQKRQQKCWKGAGSGSGGVELDSIVEFGIFSPENALGALDSDPRLQFKALV